MKNIQHSPWARRAVSVGLGVALVGGISLVAVAPAQAAPVATHVYTSDIALDENVYTGWHVGSGNGAAAFDITSAGLELHGRSQVIDGFALAQRESLDNLTDEIGQGAVGWTTTANSDPAYFQIPVFFGADAANPSFTTLRPAAPAVGVNVAHAGDQWATSSAIGTAYPANGTATLGDLLEALGAQTNVQILGFGVFADTGKESIVTGVSFGDAGSFDFVPGTRLAPGTVSISGTATVGSVLTATTAGWPDGATFSYTWSSATQDSGDVVGTDSATYTVAASDVGHSIGVRVTGTKDGSAPVAVDSEPTAVVVAPAPVADSSALAAYLADKGVTKQSQTDAGLPAGDLSAEKTYTATVNWSAQSDSHVDVYAYSTTTFLGTFPVVNGQVQITLTPAMLAALGGGAHTLVLIGQSTGSVQAVGFVVAALPFTGAGDPTVPAIVGGMLLMLGAALVIVRRRRLNV